MNIHLRTPQNTRQILVRRWYWYWNNTSKWFMRRVGLHLILLLCSSSLHQKSNPLSLYLSKCTNYIEIHTAFQIHSPKSINLTNIIQLSSNLSIFAQSLPIKQSTLTLSQNWPVLYIFLRQTPHFTHISYFHILFLSIILFLLSQYDHNPNKSI